MMSDEWPRAGDVIWIVEGSGACLRYVWSDNHTFAGMLRGYARQGRMFKSIAEALDFAKSERAMARISEDAAADREKNPINNDRCYTVWPGGEVGAFSSSHVNCLTPVFHTYEAAEESAKKWMGVKV
ncbi:hypothetical protein [Marinobacter sp.]|mgnify:FL=1|uniref:hypothetical protein n=1 Tax=Marinobacter sp. TaxID=50741 RepID=UPI002580A1B6|nr:hypothetical protein [Marinobacter sp.]